MHRRHALSIIALSTAAPAFALAAPAAGSAEADHAAKTLAVGALSLQASKLAQSTAKDSWVKRFADYEVAEQTLIAEILKSMGAAPGMVEKMSEFEKLKGASNFDAEYLAMQLAGHNDLLKIQEDYIGKGKDAAHVNMAKLARGQIKEHLDLLQTIRKNVKA